MPTLVIRGPDGTLVERELVGRLTVGCDDDNDLVLRTGGVEKRHANFFAEGGEVVLEELDASAAKTLVDGEPVRGRKRLTPGVRVLIGDYEVRIKPGEQQLSVRKVPAAPLERAPVRPFPFTLVLALFAVALVGLVGAGLYRRLSAEPEVVTPPPAAEADPCADLEPQLRVARGPASPAALAAADAVLMCDPLNEEANQAKRSIPRELDGQAHLTRAKEFLELGRDEQALDELEAIAPKTRAAELALPLSGEVALRVAAAAKKSCDTYKKPLSTPHCETYERLTKKYGAKEPTTAATVPLEERIAKRQPDRHLQAALVDWAKGRFGDAKVKLQKVLENPRLVVLHAQARAMQKDLENADGLYKIGERHLEKGDLTKAEKALRDAFELDARLLPEDTSASRKNAERTFAAKAYEVGVVHARRQNWKEACTAWKSGFAMFR
ncbi:MAG: FHA domain-containing protein, partial [Myxococcaceae bacterium]|nr:FHA domain-containing protein [Myxococcaceae bacterium]